MKICIVLPCNIYTAPFYKKYVKYFKSNDIQFDLIYWNRSLINEETYAETVYSFDKKDILNSGGFSKVLKYVQFGNYVKEKLRKCKYDKVLFLGSYAGIMAQLSFFLNKNYKNNYWLDIRDFTFENIGIYSYLMNRAIYNSYSTVISSPGYKEFLANDYEYILSHNIDFGIMDDSFKSTRSDSKKLRISFIGLVRYYEENKKLLDLMKNEHEIKLQYYGMNSEELGTYCKNKGITNVDFHPRFDPSETTSFYQITDVINNIYGNDSIELTTALSNKLYYAAYYKIPILVSKGTLMEKIVERYNFGLSVDLDEDDLKQRIIEWYEAIDWDVLKKGCEDFLYQVKRDEKDFKNKLIFFLKNK